MKNSKFYKIAVAALFASIFILSSCVPSKRNIKSETYKAGIEILDKIISTYREMSEISYSNEYNQQLISILSDKKYIKSETVCSSDDLMSKIIAFETLKKVYMKYDMSSDENFTTKTSGAAISLFNSCNALDSLDISEDISKEINIILDYISASKFDENLAIQGLTEQFIIVWKKDVAKWQLNLIKSYKNFAAGVDEIPYTIFDEEKLSKFVYEPYSSKEVMVDIYKLNLKNEANILKSTTISKLNDLTWGLETLNLVNTEYSKKSQDNNYIETTLDKINAYLLNE